MAGESEAGLVSVKCGSRSVEFSPGLFIHNEFVPSLQGHKFASYDPSTGKPIVHVYEARADDVDVAVDSAEKGLAVWSSWEPEQRAEVMYRIADLATEHAQPLAHLECLDNGKPLSLILKSDLKKVARTFRYYAGLCDKINGITLHHQKFFGYTRKEPIGVCGAVIPWNFPLVALTRKVAVAICAGNSVVLKTSEKTPLSALYFCKLLQESGLPPGTVNILSGFGPTAGAAIASHPRIRLVAFTGSVPTGKRIMADAALSNMKRVVLELGIRLVAFTGSVPTGKRIMADAALSNMKRVVLELGGKSPNIVFPDADIEQAAKFGVAGAFAVMGQVCVAGTRIFVHEDVFEEYKKEFIRVAEATKIGDPFEDGIQHGPQIDKAQYERIMNYIQSGIDEGATVACGGKRVGTTGFFIAPTLFTDVTDDMKIAKEEIFGPVVVMLPFKDESEVIERANNTEYGLAAAVFTKDATRATRVVRELKAGTCWINAYGLSDIQCPFGGFKQSGLGREKGVGAIEPYLETKCVMQNLTVRK